MRILMMTGMKMKFRAFPEINSMILVLYNTFFSILSFQWIRITDADENNVDNREASKISSVLC